VLPVDSAPPAPPPARPPLARSAQYVAQADGARGRQHAPPQSAQHQHQQHLLQQAQAQQAHMGLGPGAPQPMYALSPPLLSMHHYQQQRAPQQPPYINPAASGRQAGQHDGSAQPQPQPQLVGMCVPMAAQPGPRGLAQLGNNGLGANCASMPLASIASPAESPLFANRFSAVRAVPMANGTHFPAGYPHAALAPAPQMVAQQPVFYTTVPPSPRFGPPSAQQQPQPLQPGGAPQLGQPMRRHSGESYPVSYGYEQSPHGAPPQPLPIQVLHAQPQTQYAAAPQQQPQQQQHAGGWQYAQPQQQPQPMQASPQMQQQQHLPASPPGWHYGAQQQPPPQLAGACAGGWHYAQPQQPSQPPNELAYSSGGWQCGASAHNTDDSQLAPRQAIPSAVAHSLGGGAADRHAAEEDAQTGGGWAQGAWGQGGSAPGSVAPPAEFESGAWTSPALISDAAAHNKDNTNATAPPPQPQQQQSASYPAWVPDGGQPHVAQAVPELSVEAQNLGRFAAGTAATPGDVSNSGGSNGGGNGNGAHAHAAYEYS
jgi:hypothetical protein